MLALCYAPKSSLRMSPLSSRAIPERDSVASGVWLSLASLGKADSCRPQLTHHIVPSP